MVVLPDHLHAIWTLPKNDKDFSTRWMLIKIGFAQAAGGRTAQQKPGGKGRAGHLATSFLGALDT